MMIVPAGVKVHLALGHTDMRKGLDGLAMLVQETLNQDPFSGHLFAFRGRRRRCSISCFGMATGCVCSPSGSTKAASCGHVWQVMTITLTPAQLAMLIEGIDWRAPERVWRPALAG